MDLITGLATTANGRDCIVTGVDRLTNMSHFIPTTNKASSSAPFSASLFWKTYLDSMDYLHLLFQTEILAVPANSGQNFSNLPEQN